MQSRSLEYAVTVVQSAKIWRYRWSDCSNENGIELPLAQTLKVY